MHANEWNGQARFKDRVALVVGGANDDDVSWTWAPSEFHHPLRMVEARGAR
jgi:hypothetical protein